MYCLIGALFALIQIIHPSYFYRALGHIIQVFTRSIDTTVSMYLHVLQ